LLAPNKRFQDKLEELARAGSAVGNVRNITKNNAGQEAVFLIFLDDTFIFRGGHS
jgi:hypothetical protein